MRSRILVALVGIPVLIGAVLWAPSPILLFALCVLAGIGGVELQTCVSGGRKGALTFLAALFPALSVGASCAVPEASAAVLTAETIALFAWAVREEGRIRFEEIMAVLAASGGIGWSFASFLRMEALGVGRPLLLLPFVLSFVCDTLAFFTGRTFGRHRLSPVSPHKTVEGAAGGLAGAVLGGLLFFAVLRGLGQGGAIGPVGIVLLSLGCGVVAQIGDLSFSLIKRQYGIKDYGHLFLEHGGVLDRFDSVLFVAPVVEIVLTRLPPLP